MVMPSHNFCINVIYSYRASGFIDELGALLTFNPAPSGKTTILARVGVSLISSEQACANAEEEIPDFNFDEVHRNARAQWNDLLSRVQVDTTGVPKETVELFYSSVGIILHTYSDQDFDMQVALPHPHISCRLWVSPNIVLTLTELLTDTGENPKWNSTEPYFDSFYCNVRCAFHWSPQCWRKQWDTYRSLYPLMSLHDPVTFSRIVRAMIDIQKHEGTHPVTNHEELLGNWMVLGWLPECRGATAMHSIQGGSSTFSTKNTCFSLILMCSIL